MMTSSFRAVTASPGRHACKLATGNECGGVCSMLSLMSNPPEEVAARLMGRRAAARARGPGADGGARQRQRACPQLLVDHA